MNTERHNRRQEKRIAERNTVIAVVVSLFFVGIIFFYYTLIYNEKRDSIVKDGEIAGECNLGKYVSGDKDRHRKLSDFLVSMGW